MSDKIKELARLNDQLRCSGVGGRILLTSHVLELSTTLQTKLLHCIARFSDFSEANDPYGERDFGALEFEGVQYFWKIDYYDTSYVGLSPDPLDLSVTRRVMTVMRADEY